MWIISRIAHSLIDNYGTGANAQAVRFTHEALQRNDSLEVADWRTVEQAIALLTNESAGASHSGSLLGALALTAA